MVDFKKDIYKIIYKTRYIVLQLFLNGRNKNDLLRTSI